MITLFAPEYGVNLPTGWLSMCQVVLTVAIAAASYRWVEMPSARGASGARPLRPERGQSNPQRTSSVWYWPFCFIRTSARFMAVRRVSWPSLNARPYC